MTSFYDRQLWDDAFLGDADFSDLGRRTDADPKCSLTVNGTAIPLVDPAAPHPLSSYRMEKRGAELVLIEERPWSPWTPPKINYWS